MLNDFSQSSALTEGTFWSIGVEKHYNGNANGTVKNMGTREIGLAVTMWAEAGLDKWIPAPTQVLQLLVARAF